MLPFKEIDYDFFALFCGRNQNRTHVYGSLQYSENIVTMVSSTIFAFVKSVAVHSMKMFFVFKVIFVWSPARQKDKQFPLQNKTVDNLIKAFFLKKSHLQKSNPHRWWSVALTKQHLSCRRWSGSGAYPWWYEDNLSSGILCCTTASIQWPYVLGSGSTLWSEYHWGAWRHK